MVKLLIGRSYCFSLNFSWMNEFIKTKFPLAILMRNQMNKNLYLLLFSLSNENLFFILFIFLLIWWSPINEKSTLRGNLCYHRRDFLSDVSWFTGECKVGVTSLIPPFSFSFLFFSISFLSVINPPCYFHWRKLIIQQWNKLSFTGGDH